MARREPYSVIHRTVFYTQNDSHLSICRISKPNDSTEKQNNADLVCDAELVCHPDQNQQRGLSTRDRHPSTWISHPSNHPIQPGKIYLRCYHLTSELSPELTHATDQYHPEADCYHGHIQPQQDIQLVLVNDNSRHVSRLSTARVMDAHLDALQWEECDPDHIFEASAEVPFDQWPDDIEMRFALSALNTAAEHEETCDGALEFVSMFNKIRLLPPNSLASVDPTAKALLVKALNIVLEHADIADEVFDVDRVKRIIFPFLASENKSVDSKTSPRCNTR